MVIIIPSKQLKVKVYEKNIMLMVGRRLRNLRKSLLLSRREFERKHNVSANSIKAWEKGISEIGAIRLISYLKIFEQYSIKISIADLLQTEENYLDNINTQNIVAPFSRDITLPLSRTNQDVELICNIFKNDISALLQEKDTILKTLINNLPFKIVLKDEHNNILLLNNILANSLGGTCDDLANKSFYDLTPSMAKKYHEDDLKCINTNTRLINLIEPYKPPNSRSKLLCTNKIPIINQETNKKMVLVIAHIIG